MSSFFTLPASQKKRKREGPGTEFSSKKPNSGKPPTKSRDSKPTPRRDDSISSVASDDEVGDEVVDAAGDQATSESDEDEDAKETAAERRLRLAEQYLQNIKEEVDEIGYDAEEIDRDLIAERLQKDVAETKGKLHKYLAASLDISATSTTQFRAETRTVTSVATHPPYAYTVSKDMCLIKWQLPDPPTPPKKRNPQSSNTKSQRPIRRRPTKLISTRGNKKGAKEPKYMHHTGPILCVAASDTGQFVATGGADKRIIIWSAATLKALRVFPQHRDAVTGLAFRKGTNELFSSSKDRTIKTWSLNELAYIETLFGHQDEVVDIAAGQMERCLSVGARDRTARLWKVVEETQLVFRGGGSGGGRGGGGGGEGEANIAKGNATPPSKRQRKQYFEGSIDRIALIDEETFVTGSDNGTLSLWSLQKKKPIFSIPLAHGLDRALKPSEVSAESNLDPDKARLIVPERTPRWITALATIPYSDLVVSGSWDGVVRVWRVKTGTSGGQKKILEAVGEIGGCASSAVISTNETAAGSTNQEKMNEDRMGKGEGAEPKDYDGETKGALRGVVNDLSCFERGTKGNETICIVAAIGTETRLGRWNKIKGGKSGAVVFEVPRTSPPIGTRKKKDRRKGSEQERTG